jgi:tetratricopeptide (TPR) repeat protein
MILMVILLMGNNGPLRAGEHKGLVGSSKCRVCHEKFYQLWSTSHHGLAMQQYSAKLALFNLTSQKDDVVIGEFRYRAEIEGGTGWVREQGPDGEKKYPMVHTMGGKNVYYFLTPMERGRLQTLPIAYDVRRKEWFDTASSGVRHFPGEVNDEPFYWKEWPYTFNTACYSCHVSQLKTNYDLETDTYTTTWMEPGINCETCHGPGEEHILVCQEVSADQVPKDLKITRGGRNFTPEQNNDACASCHAKLVPLSHGFKPGDRFFDHFDLVTLEHQDFYPDGRDLGENYTFNLWRMNPCAKSDKLDCLHCHTSSGRYRFKEKGKANDVCLPCHQKRVEDATNHTHHKADSAGNKCISCHMPMTEFARMLRSDHSMLPPTPAVTLAYGSPNACNMCHVDEDAVWADKWVREWHKRDYQKPVLHRTGLMQAARDRDWEKLPEMLDYLHGAERDEVITTSLLRLLNACEDTRKWPVIRKTMQDASPLVRAAAVTSMANYLTPENADLLITATRDDFRLVRIRAADALAAQPPDMFNEEDRKALDNAISELENSFRVRPDNAMSYYNLGNFYLDRGNLQKAVDFFATAIKLRSDNILPLVNASLAYARLGNPVKAETMLEKALTIDPTSAEANFNMGLLKAEQDDFAGAEKYLRTALKSDPNFPEAAYNLAILVSKENLDDSVILCRKAYEQRPRDARYAYTLAFYLRQQGQIDEAIDILQKLVQQQPDFTDASVLLRVIYEQEKTL